MTNINIDELNPSEKLQYAKNQIWDIQRMKERAQEEVRKELIKKYAQTYIEMVNRGGTPNQGEMEGILTGLSFDLRSLYEK